MSQSILIVALAACWVWYFGLLCREHLQSSLDQQDRVSAFSHGLGTLGATRRAKPHYGQVAQPIYPRTALVPRGVNHAARRRRDVAITLAMLCVTTLFLALSFGSFFWMSHLLLDLFTASFAFASARRRTLAVERELKVHLLYPDRVGPQPHLLPAKRVVNG